MRNRGRVATETRAGLDVTVAVFDRGEIAVENLNLPARAKGEIDVAISSAAICGSDVHTVLGHRQAPARTALGHEGVGLVDDVDESAVDISGALLREGDRVVFALFSACGTCDRCQTGLPMKCRSLVKYGHESVTRPPHATGTLASHVRLLPGVPVMRIPEDIDDARVVSAGCAVATAAAIVAAIRRPVEGNRILVFGAGAVGAYCAAMLTTLGCSVHVRDPFAERLDLVEELGARADRSGEAAAQLFDVVVEASGGPEAFVDALHAADIGADVVAVGSVSPGNSTVTFDPSLIVTRRLRVNGIHNYTADNFRWGVEWLLSHGRNLALERLVSSPRPLSDVARAFEEMQAGSYPRVLVRPEQGQ
jgi:threonine 3-dehydrogenase